MLVLSRQRDESVMIGDDVEVRVVDVRGDKVRLGFMAPRDVSVHRKEVYDQIRRENRAAAQMTPDDLKGLAPPARPKMRIVPDTPIATSDPHLHAAVEEARIALSDGGYPIGAVLVRDGKVIGRAHDARVQQRDPTAHAELRAIARAGPQPAKGYAGVTLYTTHAPCPFCAAAVVHFGIPRVVVGDSAANDAGIALLRERGVEVVEVGDATCAEMLGNFIRDNPNPPHEDGGR